MMLSVMKFDSAGACLLSTKIEIFPALELIKSNQSAEVLMIDQ